MQVKDLAVGDHQQEVQAPALRREPPSGYGRSRCCKPELCGAAEVVELCDGGSEA